ncbi:hypothetical protein EB118_23295 [bacterium]|nr:hypothetical protein [bacterium]
MTTYNSANQILKINNGSAGWISNANGYTITPNVTFNNDSSSLEVKGKIIHNGQDLEERLQTIERVLMIPERDPELERQYPKLKKKYDDYIKELEKYRTWERIKTGEE